MSEIRWTNVEDGVPDVIFGYLERYEVVTHYSRPILCVIKPRTSKRPVYRVRQGKFCIRNGYRWWVVDGKHCDVIAWAPMPKYKEKENG